MESWIAFIGSSHLLSGQASKGEWKVTMNPDPRVRPGSPVSIPRKRLAGWVRAGYNPCERSPTAAAPARTSS